MSTYAQVPDLQAYTSVQLTTQSGQLQKLLDNAERDIDNLFPKGQLTDALQGIQMTGVTGGNFTLSQLWRGRLFTTPNISWNTDITGLLAALNAMTDVMGNKMPGTPWQLPIPPAEGPRWAAGPLPAVSIAVEASSDLAAQQLDALTVTSALTGGAPTASIVQLRGGGTRLDIWLLSPSQAWQLNRATCAQAEYRDQMGEDFFIKAQWDSVSGPEFRTQGKLPMMAPKARRELQGSGLLQYAARARVGTRALAARAYSPVGGTPIPDDWRAL